MARSEDAKMFDRLLQSYFSLADSAGTIARKLKKTLSPDIREKLIAELRSLDNKRIGLLQQMGDLNKSSASSHTK